MSPHDELDGTHEEHGELLTPSPSRPEILDHIVDDTGMTRSQALNLYTSHLLSTWNARTYEFAAIIFTAAAYPDTLVASSIRGIVTTVASICFSASLGRWIDHAPNRLKTLLSTITANRLSVIAACVFWVFIVGGGSVDLHERALSTKPSVSLFNGSISEVWKATFFAVVLVLGVSEKLSGAANMMSMERDWVVTVAAPDGRAYDLTRLNSVMRRIDLICKLVAPILISVVISATGSVRIGVLVVGGMSAVSWMVEWWCAKGVWNKNSNLRVPKIVHMALSDLRVSEIHDEMPPLDRIRSRGHTLMEMTTKWLRRYAQDFVNYFLSHVWIPSLALSLLHLSVLAYSATFITYLLNVGFSLNLITIARAVGSIVEISSTIVMPFGVDYLGKVHHHRHHGGPERDDEELETALLEEVPEQHSSTETGLERLGLWGLTWQLLNLVPVVLALWALSPHPSPSPSPSPANPSLLPHLIPGPPSPSLLPLTIFTFLSLSRLGLWIFDLTTQQLTQTLTPPSQRSSFAGVEASFVSTFELGHHIATIVLNKPQQFKWLATGSLAAVAISAAAYAGWVRRRRGHLVHWEKMKGCDCLRKSSSPASSSGSARRVRERDSVSVSTLMMATRPVP